MTTLHFDARQAAFITLTLVLFLGTVYSVKNNTFLDTSDPLLSHLPHHLQNTHYFANKSNVLNTFFIKRAWGWTSFAFLFVWLTSPRHTQTLRRVLQWVVASLAWLAFTRWFFGPAILERAIVLSGGECTVALPSGGSFTVPLEYCFSRITLAPETHPGLFASPWVLPEAGTWRTVPRLRSGHDVSGHVFLLTMSILFLADQIRVASITNTRAPAVTWSGLCPRMHKWSMYAALGLLALWLFALGTTSVYFHAPFEKLTGYLLGLAGYSLTLLIYV